MDLSTSLMSALSDYCSCYYTYRDKDKNCLVLFLVNDEDDKLKLIVDCCGQHNEFVCVTLATNLHMEHSEPAWVRLNAVALRLDRFKLYAEPVEQDDLRLILRAELEKAGNMDMKIIEAAKGLMEAYDVVVADGKGNLK